MTHSRVARSNILALTALAAEVRVVGPATLIPEAVEAMGMLQKVAHDMGSAVVMVSHDHRTLSYADRIVWLEDGNIEDREPASMHGVER